MSRLIHPLTRMVLTRSGGHASSVTEALAKQVRQLNEERPAVAVKARLELSGKWIAGVVVQIVVVAHIEGGPRIRRVTKQQLPARVRRQRVVVDARPGPDKAAELVSAAKRIDIVLERQQAGIVAPQLALAPIQRKVERLRRLKIGTEFQVE